MPCPHDSSEHVPNSTAFGTGAQRQPLDRAASGGLHRFVWRPPTTTSVVLRIAAGPATPVTTRPQACPAFLQPLPLPPGAPVTVTSIGPDQPPLFAAEEPSTSRTTPLSRFGAHRPVGETRTPKRHTPLALIERGFRTFSTKHPSTYLGSAQMSSRDTPQCPSTKGHEARTPRPREPSRQANGR